MSAHVWPRPPKNLDVFSGNEVDYCVSADWNRKFEGMHARTRLGEAEYELKYHACDLSSQEFDCYRNNLIEGILDSLACFPFCVQGFAVTTIPAIKEKQNKLAWKLANIVSSRLNAEFFPFTLMEDKPSMKEISFLEKYFVWKRIYDNPTLLEWNRFGVFGKNFIIVDDLYQSGVSIWSFAKFLKEKCGAKMVIAVTAVKALRDSDNRG